jgi:hypothetical protein
MNYRDILKIKWPELPVLRMSDTYEDIVWHPNKSHPTKAELDSAIVEYTQTKDVVQHEAGSFQLQKTGVLSGSYTKVEVDVLGRVMSGSSLSAIDVSTALGFMPQNTNGMVRILSSYTGQTGAVSGTSKIPADNTAPLVTEGTQLWSQTVVPATENSKFMINQVFMLGCSTNNRQITVSVFRNSTCIYVTSLNLATGGRTGSLNIHTIDLPNTTEQVVYSLRVGVNANATWYVNTGSATTYTFGGVANASDWSILELN